MFRIAICDDEYAIISQTEKILLEYAKLNFLEIDIEVFSSGEEMYMYIREEHGFDLIYLDIEMKLMNGIEVGRNIRKTLQDHKTEIVYISGKDGYERQLFDVQPLHFIPKPINPKVVIEDLNLAMLRAEKLDSIFTYKKGTQTYRISIKDIIYFESIDKEIKIVTVNHEDTFYGRIYDVFEMVAKYQFIKIHRSYIINYLHTTLFKYDEVIMSNGMQLPISQSKRKEVREIQLSIEGRNN
nr:LytTR family DNA-binding domain-containing protein [Sedimentibacter sp.]